MSNRETRLHIKGKSFFDANPCGSEDRETTQATTINQLKCLCTENRPDLLYPDCSSVTNRTQYLAKYPHFKLGVVDAGSRNNTQTMRGLYPRRYLGIYKKEMKIPWGANVHLPMTPTQRCFIELASAPGIRLTLSSTSQSSGSGYVSHGLLTKHLKKHY